jgi:hypothetical protein
MLSVGASVTRDINHISVSVGPAVTRDYRIDRNGTVIRFEVPALVRNEVNSVAAQRSTTPKIYIDLVRNEVN